MTQQTLEFKKPSLPHLDDELPPRDLHGKIMKRVFLAGYGRYLYMCAGVLLLNLSVLASQLWRIFSRSENLASLRSMFSESTASAFKTFTTVVPVETLIATTLSAFISAYLTYLFIKLYRDWRSYGMQA